MNTVSFACPEGQTPGPIFDSLQRGQSGLVAPCKVNAGGERWVAPDHEMSKARLLPDKPLAWSGVRAGGLYAVLCGRADLGPRRPERWSPQIESKLPLSVLLLEMGTDIHTASLFPLPGSSMGWKAAMAVDAPAVCCPNQVVDGDLEGPGKIWRITLSRRVLERARDVKASLYFGDETKAVDHLPACTHGRDATDLIPRYRGAKRWQQAQSLPALGPPSAQFERGDQYIGHQ